MIKAGGNIGIAIDVRLIAGRYVRDHWRFHKCDQLIVTDVEDEYRSRPDPFLDSYRVGVEYPFTKLAGLVEVEGGQLDVRNSLRLMCYCSG